MKLSVFTACTPWLPLTELIPQVAAAGYQGIEIGLRDRQWDVSKPPQFWNNNQAMLDYAQVESEAHAARAAMDVTGLACTGIGAYATAFDAKHFDTCFLAAKITKAEMLRIRAPAYNANRPYADQLADLRVIYGELCVRAVAAGTKVVIELHDHSLCPSSSAAMRVMDGLNPAGIGAIYEPANMIKEGWEAVPQSLACLGPYLAHVHIKDVRSEMVPIGNEHRKWNWSFVPLGTGLLDWPSIFAELKQAHYEGWFSIENFSESEKGVARLLADYAFAASLC